MGPTDDHEEIHRAAVNFIERFGARAVEEARQRARELDEAGNTAATRTWLQIAAAAESLLRRQS